MLKKEELNKIIKETKGKIRSVVFQTDAQYVLSRKGKEGLAKLQKRAKELGLPIDYKNAKAMEWQPLGLRIVSLLLIKDTFNWTDEDIKEMGKAAPKTSFIVKLFFRLFLSPKKLAKEVPRYWRKHYTEGNLKVIKLDEDKKKIIVHLENYLLPLILRKHLEGYFETTMALTRKSRKATALERECPHKDNIPCYEYFVTWK